MDGFECFIIIVVSIILTAVVIVGEKLFNASGATSLCFVLAVGSWWLLSKGIKDEEADILYRVVLPCIIGLTVFNCFDSFFCGLGSTILSLVVGCFIFK